MEYNWRCNCAVWSSRRRQPGPNCYPPTNPPNLPTHPPTQPSQPLSHSVVLWVSSARLGPHWGWVGFIISNKRVLGETNRVEEYNFYVDNCKLGIIVIVMILIFSLRSRAVIRRQEGNIVGISEGGRSWCRGRWARSDQRVQGHKGRE